MNLARFSDTTAFSRAVAMVGRAKGAFEQAGYEVQTTRVALPPLAASIAGADRRAAIAPLRALDRIAADAGALVNIGPVLVEDREDPSLAPWVAELLQTTSSLMCSVTVATSRGAHARAAVTAAQVMAALARSTPTGADNFRFAAGANIPPHTPFFPVAYHEGGDAIAIGLEAAPNRQPRVRQSPGHGPGRGHRTPA